MKNSFSTNIKNYTKTSNGRKTTKNESKRLKKKVTRGKLKKKYNEKICWSNEATRMDIF